MRIKRQTTNVIRDLWRAVRTGQDGVTVDTLGGELPRSGYYVGGESPSMIMEAPKIIPDDLSAFITRNPQARYFGLWLDKGKYHIDTASWVGTSVEAHQLAHRRGELSVFNILTQECEPTQDLERFGS